MSNCELVWKKPNHTEIKETVPLSPNWKAVVNNAILELQNIFSWNSKKIAWIVWPCSVDFEDSVLKYAQEIKQLQEKYNDSIQFILRFYTGKPRTVWGWKGLQNAEPWEDPDIAKGLLDSRALAIKVIEEVWLPLADEMLHPQLVKSFDDIYSYLAIGARSTENQFHREVASGLDMPVGFKNPTAGDLDVMVNWVKAWQTQSMYTLGENVYKSNGNDFSHAILRGSTFEWKKSSNYDIDSLRKVYKYITQKNDVNNPAFIIDTNHDNSAKDPSKQIFIMKEVIKNLKQLEWECLGISNMWKWFMSESYLEEWRQDFWDDITHGLSLTDPCSGLEDTKKMAQFLAEIKRD